MTDIPKILAEFESVSLEQIDAVKLLNRVDTKFLMPVKRLKELLEKLKTNYYVVEINEKRSFSYNTTYFDTPNFFYYYQHQTGRLSRLKIRLRSYIETQQSFLELKQKNNHRKTIKSRIAIPDLESFSQKKYQKFLANKCDKVNELEPKLIVKYNRLTLVNKNFIERVTIDTGLEFETPNGRKSFKNLAIIELKQNKSAISEIKPILRQMRVFRDTLSKYCLGMASLYPLLKQNNIKQKIRLVNYICYEEK